MLIIDISTKKLSIRPDVIKKINIFRPTDPIFFRGDSGNNVIISRPYKLNTLPKFQKKIPNIFPTQYVILWVGKLFGMLYLYFIYFFVPFPPYYVFPYFHLFLPPPTHTHKHTLYILDAVYNFRSICFKEIYIFSLLLYRRKHS